jgi:hypothetical protein
MKILIPVDVNKRLPEITEDGFTSDIVIVRYSDNQKAFSFVSHEGVWVNKEKKRVVEWYEEIEMESLFPDDEKSYNVAIAASGDRINGTMLHQEGQNFFKNHILRKLKE